MLMIVGQSRVLFTNIASFTNTIVITLKSIILRCISIINRVIKWWLIGMAPVCMCMIVTQEKQSLHIYSRQHYHLVCTVTFKHENQWLGRLPYPSLSLFWRSYKASDSRQSKSRNYPKQEIWGSNIKQIISGNGRLIWYNYYSNKSA